MSPKNYYTLPEITFCTFIARFGRSHLDEADIHNFSGRSLSSIKMKVQNIASMLHEAGYPTSDSVSRLTGKPAVHISEHSNQSFRDYPITHFRCFSSKLSSFLQFSNVND